MRTSTLYDGDDVTLAEELARRAAVAIDHARLYQRAQHGDPQRVALATDLFNRFPPRRSDHYGQWHVLQTGQPAWLETVDDEVLAAVAQGQEHLAILRGIGLRSFICVPLVARGAAVGVLTLAYAESGRTYRSSDVNLAMDLARRAATSADNAKLYQQLRVEDRRKNEFLGTLAHELRNPLAPCPP